MSEVTEESMQQDQKKPKKENTIINTLSNLVLLAAVAVLAAVLVLSGGEGPRRVAGFYAARVLTGSMNDVYPQGCMILDYNVDPDELEIGDDITYMANETTTITHRIVGITENFDGTGQRGFTTQGTMNPDPDKNIVPAVNVVGKVIFHSMLLGKASVLVQNYWQLILLYLALAAVLIWFLKRAWRKPDQPEDQSDDQPENQKEQQES